MPKNTWRKKRKFTEEPYYTVTDGDWKYEVFCLKKDPRLPFAAAYCRVTSPNTGPGGDIGDTYVTEVPGLVDAWLRAHEA